MLQAIPDLDFVVFTGDLVDQADEESFREFRALVQQLQVPYYLCAGNHDLDISGQSGRFDRQDFLNWCRGQFDFDPAPTGYVDYSVTVRPGLQLLCLDASLGTFPDPQGTLRPMQLQWLQAELDTHAHAAVLVLIHQPPVANSPLFRKYKVLPPEAATFRRILASHPRILGVLSGHLHVPKVYVRHQIPYLIAPPLVGPVSAFRVFEIHGNPDSRAGTLTYTWHHILPDEAPRPLWHGLVMGHHADRWGSLAVSLPSQWTRISAELARY
jgi:3',5'-cyclic AMP phosphodiesterase CpdA